jgi:hypothetical protein
MTGLADDLNGKSSPPELGFQRWLITYDEYVLERARQRGQGVERHRPGKAPPQRIRHRESGLRMLNWFESDDGGS